MRQISVNKLVQAAKKEVGRDRFENVEQEFRDYAERELLRKRIQETINVSWTRSKEFLLNVGAMRSDAWLKDKVKGSIDGSEIKTDASTD
jgi:predicted metallo-beta-lactamase superfamily hydrolase